MLHDGHVGGFGPAGQAASEKSRPVPVEMEGEEMTPLAWVLVTLIVEVLCFDAMFFLARFW